MTEESEGIAVALQPTKESCKFNQVVLNHIFAYEDELYKKLSGDEAQHINSKEKAIFESEQDVNIVNVVIDNRVVATTLTEAKWELIDPNSL